MLQTSCFPQTDGLAVRTGCLGSKGRTFCVYDICFVAFREGHPGARNRARPTRARPVGKLQIIGRSTARGHTYVKSGRRFPSMILRVICSGGIVGKQTEKAKKKKHPLRFNLTSPSFSSRLTPNRIPFRTLLFFFQYFFADFPRK